MVSWDNKEAKYDSRNWHPGREKNGKGIMLNEDEARRLMDALEKELK